jgi:hypothetical protein
MSAPSRQFPVSVDTDGGQPQINATQVLLIADPERQHVTVYHQTGSGITPLLDEPYEGFVEGTAPREVGGRHQFLLADGRTLYVRLEGGCGCGSPMKAFMPASPPVSNRRLT